MSDNGWPGEPGVPLNPERDGWHWLCAKLGDPEPFYWNGNFWQGSDQWSTITFSRSTRYLGPALTPAEVDARIKEARRDALEKCISICNAVTHANRVEYPAKWKDRPEGIPHDWQQAWETCAETAEDIAAAIRALKGEGDD
jgi:hypothetical protein